MRKLILPFLFYLCIAMPGYSQSDLQVDRVAPPFWWTGMEHPGLQIMLHGSDIGDYKPHIDYPGVTLRRISRVQSDHYLFLHLSIADSTEAGRFTIQLQQGDTVAGTLSYQLKKRDQKAGEIEGFDSSDVIYLITPDRYANGNPSNDYVKGMLEKPDRDNPDGRHGGDIAGIRQHLDDIADMGFSAIWLNPLLENNQPEYSYHGYSTTNYYKIDPRFGTNQSFKKMVQEASNQGIKVIMDQIVNHVGSRHWWVKDPPTSHWFHHQDQYVQTNHEHITVLDPHAAARDRERFVNGWFVRSMPDLNHDQPLLATYLIQHSIWWIEYAGLGGIRMDTYPYSGADFMQRWTCRVMEEYPHFTIVGEEWNTDPAVVSYWQRGKINEKEYESCLPSLMDFPLQDALHQSLTGENGFEPLYHTIARDFLYADADNLVVFPDNHDMDRFYTQVNRQFGLWKLGIAYILTTRGIPQIYYGTEILMSNPDGTGHGVIRSDYPGGWPGDRVNAFTGKGLTHQQQKAKQFLARLNNWRARTPVIHTGQLTHYRPRNGVYVYFRHHKDQKIMVVLNKNREPVDLNLRRYREMIGTAESGTDIITQQTYRLANTNSLKVPARNPLILELK